MNNARLEKSDRLQRVYSLLQTGPKTTLEIVYQANVMAVSAVVSELRENGIRINCERIRQGVYLYRLERLF